MKTEDHLPLPWWRAQPDEPAIDAWKVSVGFAPNAPWNRAFLGFAFAERRGYLTSSAEALSAALEARLRSANLEVRAMPSVADIEALAQYQRKRTPAQEQQIRREVDLNYFRPVVVARAVEPEFATMDLVQDLLTDAQRPLFYAKLRYNHVRAYQLFPELAPTFLPKGEFPMHPSFPSGHSTQAHLIVNVIEEVFKGESIADDARKLAWQIGRNREIAGLHYPTDTQAGFHFANVIIEDARKNPKFVDACRKARAEYP